MESGAVPPPRRAAPRSLLKPPPQAGAKGQREVSGMNGAGSVAAGASAGYVGGSSAANRDEEIDSLRRALQHERSEHERFHAMLKDEVAKLERSMQHQSQLEEELVSKDAVIDSLSGELKLLKQKKQSADSELAQFTADYMNSQAKWLEQVDGLNDEVQTLKSKLLRSQEDLDLAKKEAEEYRKQQAKDEAEKKRRESRAARPDNVQVAADELAKHQNDLLIKELRSCHVKLRDEIQEIREMNERLKEDNEHYQYLLIEHTITDKLAPPLQAAEKQHTPRTPSNASSGSVGFNAENAGDISGGGGLGINIKDGETTTMADDEVLYDLKPMSTEEEKEPSLAEDSAVSEESPGSLQKLVNQQKFELRSLQNHNRALRLSLERLVDRLLDNKSFSRAVEESVSSTSVQRFRKRVASCSEDPMSSTASLASTTTASSASPKLSRDTQGADQQMSASSMWSNMIFNSQYTGAATRRVFSMGVDNEFKPPPPPSPLQSQTTGTSVSTRRGSLDGTITANGSPATSKITPMKYSFGHLKSVSPNLRPDASHPSEIDIPKRADSLTGIRKLRLAE